MSSLRGERDLSSVPYTPPDAPADVAVIDDYAYLQVAEDTGYLTNPGIGWQDGPEPYGYMHLPETVSYSNRRKIGWKILNPEPGSYDWEELNLQLDQASRSGKQFSFRVYTYVGESFDGSMVPKWVLDEGATLLSSGEPDYSNCAYQEYWGLFVEELRRVYDGNPNLAFIDISGYGNFSEWSWQDRQTEWDTAWEDNYANGTPSPDSFETLDGQARRRLVDMFIGGSFQGHSCRAKDGTVVQVNYSYPGFHSTQLVMPYAGIVQSTQYAFSSRRDVGFRYDCLGRDGQKVYEKVGDEISQLWKSAPVVFELCKPDEVDLEDAKWLLQTSHGSIVHNNNWTYSYEELEDMMRYAGYRFFLEKANMHINHRTIDLEMSWQNTGYSPPYAKMGQVFILRFYLLDITGATVLDRRIRANISKWYPSESLDMNDPPDNRITTIIQLPISIQPGTYYAGLSIIDRRTGKPINLAFSGRDKNGVNILFPVTIK